MTSTFNILLTTTETAPRTGAGYGMRAIRTGGPKVGRVDRSVVIAFSDGGAIGHEVFTDARNLGALAAGCAG